MLGWRYRPARSKVGEANTRHRNVVVDGHVTSLGVPEDQIDLVIRILRALLQFPQIGVAHHFEAMSNAMFAHMEYTKDREWILNTW